jgi:hypothetical protein
MQIDQSARSMALACAGAGAAVGMPFKLALSSKRNWVFTIPLAI